jgi:hypothetical protein
VDDLKAAIDATVVKRGVINIVFHPHGWVRSDQMVELIDHAVRKHGTRVKFLNFRECLERLNANLLAGQSLRAANGQDNGVRLLDVNGDGYLDVVIGNEELRRSRVWVPAQSTWGEAEFPEAIVDDADVRFGILRPGGVASCVVADSESTRVWHFDGRGWIRDAAMEKGLDAAHLRLASKQNVDQGLRLRDIDGDGRCEILVSNPRVNAVLTWDDAGKSWRQSQSALPDGVTIVDGAGCDAGLRFVDLDGDGHDDIIFSDDKRYAVHRYNPQTKDWGTAVRSGSRGEERAVPMIVRGATNNGAWFADARMWVQNEDTARLADGVERMTFEELVGR